MRLHVVCWNSRFTKSYLVVYLMHHSACWKMAIKRVFCVCSFMWLKEWCHWFKSPDNVNTSCRSYCLKCQINASYFAFLFRRNTCTCNILGDIVATCYTVIFHGPGLQKTQVIIIFLSSRNQVIQIHSFR